MNLRRADMKDLDQICDIIAYAIAQRKADGSDQWQDGYPNRQTITNDITSNNGYVLEENGVVLLYAAILFEEEPAYTAISGKWLSEQDYAVLHRVAASPLAKGKSAATQLFLMVEDMCRERQIHSIKVDTNFDNIPMLKILEKLGYTYCGEVFFRGSPRKAFEKLISPAAGE